MPAPIPFTAGATLQLGLVLQYDDGTPIDISQAVMSSAFRDALGNSLGAGTLTLAAATGACVLTMAPDQTAEFPSGTVFGEVDYTLPAGVFYSETFRLAVTQPINGGG